MSADEALRELGLLIRSKRNAASMTQDMLGNRAGIVGKYVSEIERGTRDVPFSTLYSVVEDGLGLRLDITFETRNANGSGVSEAPRPPLPPTVEEVARAIADLPAEVRTSVLELVRGMVGLAKKPPG